MQTEADWIAALKTRAQAGAASDRFSHDAFYDPATRQIITADTLTDGVHFRSDWASPEDIGWKAIAVNYSDIAATGGHPEWVVVSLSAPTTLDQHVIDALYAGMATAMAAYGGSIIGGDTTRGEHLSISITALGRLASGATPGRRNTAQAGQKLVLSPPCHGLASVGLWALENKQATAFPEAVLAYHRPQPQLNAMQALAFQRGQRGQTLCSMDTSDGLADAAIQLARESGCDIVINADTLPTHPELTAYEAQSGQTALEKQLYGGDDFGILYTLNSDDLGQLPDGHCVIGEARTPQNPSSGKAILRQHGQETLLDAQQCYQHFSPVN